VLAQSLRGLAVLAFGALVALLPAAHAHADPSVQEIERQIDEAWVKLEPIIEQYNQVHSQLKSNQAKAAALQKQLQPLELEVEIAMSRVSSIAVQAYKTGKASTLNALLVSGSPATLAEQMSRLEAIARQQRQQISGVAEARDKYAADKRALDALIEQQARQDAELVAKRKDIEAQINNLQQLRIRAYGSPNGGTGNLKPVACPVEYAPGAAGKAAQTACSQIGKPYVYATEGPNSYDCSGLTLYAWKAAGVSLYHFTGEQYRTTRRVSRAELRPGDLVFFYPDRHHVGLYVGGDWMVHAPRAGDVVRMKQISSYGVAVNGYGRVG